MLTKGTGPVQLHLIVQVTGYVIHITAISAPLVTLRIVELIVGFYRLLVVRDTCFGINPFDLRVIVEVVDTTATFREVVIPCNHGTGIQALGDEVQVLLQHEVGIDAGRGLILCTTQGQTHGTVIHIGGTRQIAPRTVTVFRKEHIRADIIDTIPTLCFLPLTPASLVPRRLPDTV